MPTLLLEQTSFSIRKKRFSQSFAQSLLSLILIIGLFVTLFHNLYDGLGRRIQTTSQGNTVSYYYDPCFEFLELGHSLNGNRTWNLFGPDRSGTYGGAQGIGGLEVEYDQNSQSSRYVIDNFFGDILGYIQESHPFYYNTTLGGYGPMPGSDVNHDLEPEWRGHYLDWTGFYYMGARYYDPNTGRFLSADPLGHSASMDLYSYCNGDPVNGLDPDGRCVEKGAAIGGMMLTAAFGGPAAYTGVNALSDSSGLTDTSSLSDGQQLQYNTQVATLTSAIQDTTFAISSAVTPYNQIYSEPMRFEVGDGMSEVIQPQTLEVGGSLREPGVIPGQLYHYTAEENVAGILENGLQPSKESGQIFTTPNSGLTPIQAQMELALRPNRALPNALLEINAAELQKVGRMPIFGPVRVQPIGTAPGGGQEIIFQKDIPPQFIRRVY